VLEHNPSRALEISDDDDEESVPLPDPFMNTKSSSTTLREVRSSAPASRVVEVPVKEKHSEPILVADPPPRVKSPVKAVALSINAAPQQDEDETDDVLVAISAGGLSDEAALRLLKAKIKVMQVRC
jgi:hypothetical protein